MKWVTLAALAALLLSGAPASAATGSALQPAHLASGPLDVYTDGVGTLQFRFRDGPGVFDTSTQNPARAGLAIVADGTPYLPQPGELGGRTGVSGPTLGVHRGTQTLTSVYDVGPTLRVTEVVSVKPHSLRVGMHYEIENLSATDGVDLLAGELGDLHAGGTTNEGRSFLEGSGERYLGGTNADGSRTGLVEITPWKRWAAGSRSDVFGAFATLLQDGVVSAPTDNAVGAQWSDELAPGDTVSYDVAWRLDGPTSPNTFADNGDGLCTPDPGGCTLREAVSQATDGDTIRLAAGTYEYAVDATGIAIASSPAIVGAGANLTTIRSRGGRVFTVCAGRPVISGVTLEGGDAGYPAEPATGLGGGVYVGRDAELELAGVAIRDNHADAGGGIYSKGGLTVRDSTISGNQALSDGGGGVAVNRGVTALTNTTVSGNTAVEAGGGIRSTGATLELANATIAGNQAPAGAALHHEAVLVDNVPVGATRATNSVVGGSCDTGVLPLAIQSSHSVFDSATCAVTPGSTRVVGALRLGPLAFNGGPTATHALLAGSPAVDAGGAPCPALDQRGVARPSGRACDAGAYELAQPRRVASSPSLLPPAARKQPLPPPVAGKTVNVLPESGTVMIKLPGSQTWVVLVDGQQIPVGSVVDTRKGRVTLVAAANRTGATATAEFYAGVFKVGQTKGSKPITELTLVEKLTGCTASGKASAAGKKKVRKRRLWGDGKGRFRTKGKHSAATVVGTRWLVADTCRSTLTRVVRGRVEVRDFGKRKTVLVKAGKKYVARAR
jgi:predicted outer membrane repeat protein